METWGNEYCVTTVEVLDFKAKRRNDRKRRNVKECSWKRKCTVQRRGK